MIVLKVSPEVRDSLLADLRGIADRHPGEENLTLEAGERTLILGDGYGLDGSVLCRAELAEHGEVTVT